MTVLTLAHECRDLPSMLAFGRMDRCCRDAWPRISNPKPAHLACQESKRSIVRSALSGFQSGQCSVCLAWWQGWRTRRDYVSVMHPDHNRCHACLWQGIGESTCQVVQNTCNRSEFSRQPRTRQQRNADTWMSSRSCFTQKRSSTRWRCILLKGVDA